MWGRQNSQHNDYVKKLRQRKQPQSEWEEAREDFGSEMNHPPNQVKGKVIPSGWATLVVSLAKLQMKVLRLENLGILAKWYGASLN